MEKEEELHRLQGLLHATTQEMNVLKARALQEKDQMQTWLQQQQDIHEKQLRTAVGGIEMEFRKEHQYHKILLALLVIFSILVKVVKELVLHLVVIFLTLELLKAPLFTQVILLHQHKI